MSKLFLENKKKSDWIFDTLEAIWQDDHDHLIRFLAIKNDRIVWKDEE